MANYLQLKQQFNSNKKFIKQVLNDQKCQLRLQAVLLSKYESSERSKAEIVYNGGDLFGGMRYKDDGVGDSIYQINYILINFLVNFRKICVVFSIFITFLYNREKVRKIYVKSFYAQ